MPRAWRKSGRVSSRVRVADLSVSRHKPDHPQLDALHAGSSTVPPVAHGDVKPDNARLTPDGGIRLVDFGLLRAQGTTRAGPAMATLPYTAPEIFAAGGPAQGTGEPTKPPTSATLAHRTLALGEQLDIENGVIGTDVAGSDVAWDQYNVDHVYAHGTRFRAGRGDHHQVRVPGRPAHSAGRQHHPGPRCQRREGALPCHLAGPHRRDPDHRDRRAESSQIRIHLLVMTSQQMITM
jgi:hypothetical protein